MATLSSPATRRLSGANYELTSRRGITNALLLAGLALMVLTLAAAGVQLLAPVVGPASVLAELRRENELLREEAERARIELQFERATRSELDRQAAELNDRVNQLTTQLEFFNAHSGKKRKGD
jgi:hypothetical protein